MFGDQNPISLIGNDKGGRMVEGQTFTIGEFCIFEK